MHLSWDFNCYLGNRPDQSNGPGVWVFQKLNGSGKEWQACLLDIEKRGEIPLYAKCLIHLCTVRGRSGRLAGKVEGGHDERDDGWH